MMLYAGPDEFRKMFDTFTFFCFKCEGFEIVQTTAMGLGICSLYIIYFNLLFVYYACILDTAVARKKTHLQPTATYIATTSVSSGRTKTTKTTKDPTSTRQWPAPETTPHHSPPLHTPTPMKWPTSRTASPTSSSNDIAEEVAASAKPNTTCETETTDTTAPTTTTWQSVSPTANGSRRRSPATTYYSLGEATEYYTRWLEDPNHFPNGPHPEIGSRAPLTHDDFRSDARLEQVYFLVPQVYPPTPPPQFYDSDEESDTDQPYNNYAQTYEEEITAQPDDTTGILDSGAMMTTATRRHLAIHHHWRENIRSSTPRRTSIRYGNMETEAV
jgi:hypothetical protein